MYYFLNLRDVNEKVFEESDRKCKTEPCRPTESVLVEREGFVIPGRQPMFTMISQRLSYTPSHLVVGRRLLEQPPVTDSPVNTLAKRERYSNGLLTNSRSRWNKEYSTWIKEYQKLIYRELRRTIQLRDTSIQA